MEYLYKLMNRSKSMSPISATNSPNTSFPTSPSTPIKSTNDLNEEFFSKSCPSNPSSPKTTVASPQTAITEQPVGGISTEKVSSGSQQEAIQTVAQDHTTHHKINPQVIVTGEGEENCLPVLEESYCLPATTESTHSFSFLVEQLNNCDIKEGDSIVCDNAITPHITLSSPLKEFLDHALSSDDEAFVECESFTSLKEFNSLDSVKASEESNNLADVTVTLTHDTTFTEKTDSINDTFKLDSDNSDISPVIEIGVDSDKENGPNSGVEFATEVLEDSLEGPQLIIQQSRTPLAEIPVDEILASDTSALTQQKIKVLEIDTETLVSDIGSGLSRKISFTHKQEENIVIAGQEIENIKSDLLDEIIDKVIESSEGQPISLESVQPENVPLPKDDEFDDLENQENVPPIEVNIERSITDSVTISVDSLDEVPLTGKTDLNSTEKNNIEEGIQEIEKIAKQEFSDIVNKITENNIEFDEDLPIKSSGEYKERESLSAFEQIEAEIDQQESEELIETKSTIPESEVLDSLDQPPKSDLQFNEDLPIKSTGQYKEISDLESLSDFEKFEKETTEKKSEEFAETITPVLQPKIYKLLKESPKIDSQFNEDQPLKSSGQYIEIAHSESLSAFEHIEAAIDQKNSEEVVSTPTSQSVVTTLLQEPPKSDSQFNEDLPLKSSGQYKDIPHSESLAAFEKIEAEIDERKSEELIETSTPISQPEGITPLEEPSKQDLTFNEDLPIKSSGQYKEFRHSESLAAFEKIEEEFKQFTIEPQTKEQPEIQNTNQDLNLEHESVSFIVGTMPESIPMDVDIDFNDDIANETFDFPPPPQDMLNDFDSIVTEPSEETASVSPNSNKSKLNGNGEVFVEDFSTMTLDTTFKKPNAPAPFNNNLKKKGVEKNGLSNNLEDEVFQNAAEFQFSASDFDYLEAFDSRSDTVDRRSSLLLKFDPLLKQIVPDASKTQKIIEENENELNEDAPDTFKCLNDSTQNPFENNATVVLDVLDNSTPDHNSDIHQKNSPEDNSIEKLSNDVPIILNNNKKIGSPKNIESEIPTDIAIQSSSQSSVTETCNDKMSITYVNNHVMKDINNIEDVLKSEKIMSAQENTENMSELDKKVKNEVLKAEELEKKLEEESKKRMEVEQREEQLLKRVVEKEKAYTKLQNIVAEYEKAISEMITEKEQLVAKHERECTDLRADSETNALHLSSLETTFSDLHAKYERTKQMAMDLKEREAMLAAEKRILEESLKMQEQRYEKMKNHAVQQLESANLKLSEQLKTHSMDLTKLRAQLKKEEISRASIHEQLLQKSKENEELMKICDELINGGGTS